MRAFWIAACCGLLGLVFARPALAFCRSHTLDPAMSTCPDECEMAGLPLAWHTPNLTYAFHQRGFTGISDAEVRRMFAQSTATWEAVLCDGESIGLSFEADPSPTDRTYGHTLAGPNVNAMALLSAAQWKEEGFGSFAYATTNVAFDKNNGELLGADIMFNEGMGPFGECPDEGCPDDSIVDLRNVVTHEFGHFLGLSHSNTRGTAMFCGADRREVTKRTLAADDIEGICEAYPPEQAFMEPERGKKRGGCAVGGEAGGGLLAVALVLLLRTPRPWRRTSRRVTRRPRR